MNIFYLDHDPKKAAEYMVDKHVVKMILETAQILSTTHRTMDGMPVQVFKSTGKGYKIHYKLDDFREKELYKATHINHPSTIWARTTAGNYSWLLAHFKALLDEYTYRYGKRHKSSRLMNTLGVLPHMIGRTPFHEPPCAMGEEFIISKDPVENYRNYYNKGKPHLHKWTKRTKPDWITT